MTNIFRKTLNSLTAAGVLSAETLSALPVAEAALEKPQIFKGDYVVSFLGLTVAKSTVSTTIANDLVTTRGSMSSAGLAKLFDKTQATVVSAGKIGTDKVEPRLFRLTYTSGKSKQRTEIHFADGKVKDTINAPKARPTPKNWVPIASKDLLAVTDPLTGSIVRAKSLADVCKRTIRTYDGQMRSDVVLSFKSTGTIAIDGYSGPTVTCTAKYRPVAGYQKDKYEINYMRDRSAMTITFAPLGKTGLYAPVHATVGTQIGTVTVRARGRTVASN